MEPLTLMILAGAVDLVGGLISAYGASEAQAKADEILKNAGDLSPASILKAGQDVLGPTEFNKITQNPEYQQAQSRSLAALGDIADNGGLNLTDRAAINDVTNDVNANTSRARRAALDNLAARGMANSGMGLAAQLDAQQADANRLSAATLNTAAQARQRALDAIMARGNLAGSMAQADYARQADRARAQDGINQAQWNRRYQSRLDARGAALGDAQRASAYTQDMYDRVGNGLSGIGGGLMQGAAQNYYRGTPTTTTATGGLTAAAPDAEPFDSRGGFMVPPLPEPTPAQRQRRTYDSTGQYSYENDY